MVYIFSYYDPISDSTIYVDLESCPSFPYSHKLLDPPIQSDYQDGYRFSRPRFTKSRKSYTINFDYLIDEDKKKLENMEKAVKRVSDFTYYYEFPEGDNTDSNSNGIPDILETANSTKVILSKAIDFELAMRTKDGAYWNIKLNIEEV